MFPNAGAIPAGFTSARPVVAEKHCIPAASSRESCVLRGCFWKTVPREYGAASSVHTYFQEWLESGFFHTAWAQGLMRYAALHGIDREWLSVDGAM